MPFQKGHPKPKNAYSFPKGHPYRFKKGHKPKHKFKKGHKGFRSKESYQIQSEKTKGLPHPWSKGITPKSCFKKGHEVSDITKKKISDACKGSKHWNWKDNIAKSADGHILIRKPEHPFATYWGYVRRSRLVMEKIIGRYLTLEEIVHHKNKNPADDKPENLQLFENNSKHTQYHHPKGIKYHRHSSN